MGRLVRAIGRGRRKEKKSSFCGLRDCAFSLSPKKRGMGLRKGGRNKTNVWIQISNRAPGGHFWVFSLTLRLKVRVLQKLGSFFGEKNMRFTFSHKAVKFLYVDKF